MSRRAWAYIWFVLSSGAVLAGLYLAQPLPGAVAWFDFVALTLLATLAQLFKALLKSDQRSERGTTTYSIGLIILFAGLYLLPTTLIAPFVIIPYLIDWLKERLAKSANLPKWYIQPFNIATHLIAAICARSVFTALLREGAALVEPASILAALLGALTYVLMNHALIGSALNLARGVRLRESGVFGLLNLTNDLIQLCLGYVVAVLWQLSPILVVPALSPLLTIYQALQIPQLKQEAQTDAKTGLWNARHFRELFAAELERARRFSRPVALVMSDLDLLRNVNNTYGHLAGDAVLAGVGRIIRDMARDFDIPARFGGEEFCIGLLEAGPEAADAFAERLRVAIASTPFDVPTSAAPIHVTLSLGVACFPEDATSLDELIHQADVAVYQAKLSGRDRVAHASDAPHSARLEDAPAEAGAATQYAAAFAVRMEPARSKEPPPSPKMDTAPAGGAVARQRQP
ncbi:MAG TPA: GGDEF domain-containing protein, partial [Anaerolineae bacterium]|nr:GGDEF domain-containing protein [Anaerolineae bacterium]